MPTCEWCERPFATPATLKRHQGFGDRPRAAACVRRERELLLERRQGRRRFPPGFTPEVSRAPVDADADVDVAGPPVAPAARRDAVGSPPATPQPSAHALSPERTEARDDERGASQPASSRRPATPPSVAAAATPTVARELDWPGAEADEWDDSPEAAAASASTCKGAAAAAPTHAVPPLPPLPDDAVTVKIGISFRCDEQQGKSNLSGADWDVRRLGQWFRFIGARCGFHVTICLLVSPGTPPADFYRRFKTSKQSSLWGRRAASPCRSSRTPAPWT